MEPLSAGASVLAFNILTQLRQCRALTEPNVDLHNIRNLLDACTQDIASFKKDLDKVQCDPTTTKYQQVWKRVRATLAEKSLTGMWLKLNHHCNVLQFQLNLLQSDATLDCKTQIHEIQDTLSAGNLQVSSLLGTVQDVKVSVEEVVRSTAASVNHTIGQASGATNAQLQNISTLLEAIQAQVSAGSTRSALFQHHHAPLQEDSPLSAHSNEPVGVNPELSECLARLCRLGSRDSGTIFYEEAETIIEDLECFLSALLELKETEAVVAAKKTKEERGQDAMVTRRDMKRIRGLISASGAIDVNQAPKRLTTPRARKVVQKQHSIELTLPGCKATITVSRRAFQEFCNPPRQGQLTNDSHAEEFFATVKASIDDVQSPAVLVAYLRQVRSENGFSSLRPVICIGKTLPIGSAIFHIVSQGDVEGLRRLLARGEGSLRDRDSRGTPLLHYAVAGARTKIHGDMCSFLIDNGADVDQNAQRPWMIDGDSRTAMWLAREAAIEFEAISDHFRLLLDAGAGPCSALYDNVDDPDFRFKLSFDHNAMKMILNNSIPFVDIGSRDSQGSTMLLSFAAKCSSYDDPVSLFTLYLAKGADISVRDGHGRNCLRLALESLWDEECNDQVRKCVALLIRNGADIHSVDEDGVSVSDYAYENPIQLEIGSCRGDVWDAALSECGYDIRQMRHGYHRLPVCPDGDFDLSEYQQKSITRLWKGREDACPYYHHPPAWCPRSTLPSGLCPFGGHDWLCPGPEAAPSQHPESPLPRTQKVSEPETDDLHGGVGIVRAGSKDSHCTTEEEFYAVKDLKDSDPSLGREEMEVNGFNGPGESVSGTAQIRAIAQEDPAAESASDSSSEYYDLYNDT
ncbi:hypothetical protein AYL99_00964 [Fonsecaea erecta]|uniref:Uncharacterized protein n=1 Tax=Fonsecaea erecta TaxID=1367422 RepID=A0A178ZZ40_9EURO|nr:hypothetical protein AYL99_00964 [Fonsecaea erecta]OAP64992.1 hypothetical protein AYL99_00964 [Fonsecaea erecta]